MGKSPASARGTAALGLRPERISVGIRRGRVETDKPHQLRKLLSGQVCVHGSDGNAGGCRSWKAINPSCDCRERDSAKSLPTGDVQAGAITAFEELLLSSTSAPPDRPDRVDDVGGRQTIPAGEPRLPRWTAAQSTAFGKKLRSRSPVDRAIDPTAAEQRGVRRIDDRIDPQAGDVPRGQADAGGKFGKNGHGPTATTGEKIPNTASPRLTRSGESLQEARGAGGRVNRLIQHHERPAATAHGRRTQTDAASACFRSATWRVRRGDQVRAGSARVPVVPAAI